MTPSSTVGGKAENEEMGSSDEALCEMLGLASIEINGDETPDSETDCNESVSVPLLSVSHIDSVVKRCELSEAFNTDSFCVFPEGFRVPGKLMRRITDELVWGGDNVKADRTYETTRVRKRGIVEERRTLTRLENFVNDHPVWRDLCHQHLANCISNIVGTKMVLYKEKLNLKPPGGSGFAPHLDAPSLRVALGDDGPQSFVTVMVAIDDMTDKNGCLRICKGHWSSQNHCHLIPPEQDGNPDGGGRAGAIPHDIAETMDFQHIVCRGGDVVAFNSWAPHRSSANTSPFGRRAVFLTYNPESEGSFHDEYYARMEELRNSWRSRVGLSNCKSQMSADEQSELDALRTIPKI